MFNINLAQRSKSDSPLPTPVRPNTARPSEVNTPLNLIVCSLNMPQLMTFRLVLAKALSFTFSHFKNEKGKNPPNFY